MFSTRSGRLFIVIMSFLFLALLTPVMLKVVMPEILQAQFPNLSKEDVSMMVNASQLTSVQGFMSDLFELGGVIVSFAFCGIVAQEIRDNTLVFPILSGNRLSEIVSSKLLFHGGLISIMVIGSLMLNFLYSGMLFVNELLITDILLAGMLQGLFYFFLIANLIFWGALIKRTLPTGFMTLLTIYLTQAIGSLFDLHAYMPSGLIHFSSTFQMSNSGVISSVLITLSLIIFMVLFSIQLLKRMEYNTR